MVVFRRPEDGRAWVRNVPGDGGQVLRCFVKKNVMYQAASTSRADKNLIRACRIYWAANNESIIEIKLSRKKTYQGNSSY